MKTMYFDSYDKALSFAVNARRPRSAWDKGVMEYAEELIENLRENIEGGYIVPPHPQDAEKALLNGARNWLEYSEGACSLIDDADIARRLCTASELRKTRNGERDPNPRENWIQCQARALSQAAWKIVNAAHHVAACDGGGYSYQQ